MLETVPSSILFIIENNFAQSWSVSSVHIIISPAITCKDDSSWADIL